MVQGWKHPNFSLSLHKDGLWEHPTSNDVPVVSKVPVGDLKGSLEIVINVDCRQFSASCERSVKLSAQIRSCVGVQ